MHDKQQYLADARTVITSYRRKLDQLRFEALQVDEDTRMRYQLHIGELQSHLLALLAGMDDLEKSQGESWQQLKRSVENASREFSTRLERVLTQ